MKTMATTAALLGLFIAGCCGGAGAPVDVGETLDLVPADQNPPDRAASEPFGFQRAYFVQTLEGASKVEVAADRFAPGDRIDVWFEELGPFWLDDQGEAQIGCDVTVHDRDGQVVHEAGGQAVRLRIGDPQAPFLDMGALVQTESDWSPGEYVASITYRDELGSAEVIHEARFTLVDESRPRSGERADGRRGRDKDRDKDRDRDRDKDRDSEKDRASSDRDRKRDDRGGRP